LSWWEKVRRAVSLVVTVLVALALAVAVTRPGPKVAATSRGRLLIVLDSSWSMLARASDGATRWQHALAGGPAPAAAGGRGEGAGGGGGKGRGRARDDGRRSGRRADLGHGPDFDRA